MNEERKFRENHYVPQWYQRRFIPAEAQEEKFYYLDLHPVWQRSSTGHRYKKKALNKWGPPSCFKLEDLYTTRIGSVISTEIEEKLFGRVDSLGKKAVNYFSNKSPMDVSQIHFENIVEYMDAQRLRTPRALDWIGNLTRSINRNKILYYMQQMTFMHATLWTEGIWSIIKCNNSNRKFIISDNPVTFYNIGAPPSSNFCKHPYDVDIRCVGTQTLFPLDMDTLLTITHLGWLRNPYQNPLKNRINPNLYRDTVFSFTDIQFERQLSDYEVDEVNFIIKNRAQKFIASYYRDDLYPEGRILERRWARLGKGYLLMPDPRAVGFHTETVFGYRGGGGAVWDEYGRKPGQPGFDDEKDREREWRSYDKHKGEFEDRFGSEFRGRSANTIWMSRTRSSKKSL